MPVSQARSFNSQLQAGRGRLEALPAHSDVAYAWWFRPMANANALVRLLADQPRGAFAVRQSLRFEGCFVLTVALGNPRMWPSLDKSHDLICAPFPSTGGPAVQQLLIERVNQGFRLERTRHTFDALSELIAFYCTPAAAGVLGFVLRPDVWPLAGEVVRPVVTQHTHTLPAAPSLPPLPPAVPVIKDVYTYETEQVETELIFDIEEVDDEEEYGEPFATTEGDNDILFDSATLREAFNESRIYDYAKQSPRAPKSSDSATSTHVREEVRTTTMHVFDCEEIEEDE